MKPSTFFSILLPLILLSHCATIGGTKQALSIDSIPRGQHVYDPDNPKSPIGITPFFTEVEREHAHRFLFTPPLSIYASPTRRHLFRQSCNFRWGSAALGNIPLGVIPTFTPVLGFFYLTSYLVGLGTDLTTGAAFSCPTHILIPLDYKNPPTYSSCRRIFVLPPHDDDEKRSDFITLQWLANYHQKQSRCHLQIDLTKHKELLASLNLTHTQDIQFKNLNIDHINRIGLASEATHLALIEHEQTNKELHVKATLYDIHSLKKITEDKSKIDVSGQAWFYEKRTAQQIFKYFKIIPNSIAYAPSSVAIGSSLSPNVLKADITTETSYGEYLSSWLLTNIEHPNRYRLWDYSFNFSPSLLASFIKRKLSLKLLEKETSRIIKDHDINLFLLTYIYTLTTTLHSPVGAFFFEMGGGPLFSWWKEPQNLEDWSIETLLSLTLGYSFFLSSNLYLRIQLSVYQGLNPIATFKSFSLDGWEEGRITIGYYFPTLKTFFRNLF